MSKAESGKTEKAWDALFAKYQIEAHVRNDGTFRISADQIKEFREPRLMAKFDHFKNLPSAFQNSGLGILPVSRGDYVIGPFSLFENLPDPLQSGATQHVSLPSGVESVSPSTISRLNGDLFCDTMLAEEAGRSMKAYFLLCNGCEEVEALMTADILSRAGIDTVLVSPYGMKDVIGAHGFNIVTDMQFGSSGKYDEFTYGDGDAVILPGGMPGTKNLAASKGVAEMIRSYDHLGKLVCAICAAPSVLGANGLLQGHEATCFPGFEGTLTGAKFVGGPAVISGNIITGKSLGCAMEFGLAIVTKLLGEAKASQVEASVYRA